MKSAVIFGARQRMGFELCSRLLDNGYKVYGIDHRLWITEEQEDHWLMIARNANLGYFELTGVEDIDHCLPENEECLYILPAVDYYEGQNEGVQNQFILSLERMRNLNIRSPFFLVIQPPATHRNHAPFSLSLKKWADSMDKLEEYYLSPSVYRDEEQDFLRVADVGKAAEKVVEFIQNKNLMEIK
ncbi:hypothetical protein ACFSCZ_09410 [Siminovitchia sediminis]|uniref:NAD(P)-binding domain-containing protein n=1 Tax=Siminovitchia sediminis TaxID=1274353 RepID=A0ABW4KJJ2_9BACI